jgi:hypothetical protein
MASRMSYLRVVWTVGLVIGVAGRAIAQSAPVTNPAKSSIFKGTVAQYALTPPCRGDRSNRKRQHGSLLVATIVDATRILCASWRRGDDIGIANGRYPYCYRGLDHQRRDREGGRRRVPSWDADIHRISGAREASCLIGKACLMAS